MAEDYQGQFIAIQCKNYASDTKIGKGDKIDSFLAESNTKDFAYRYLVLTTDRITQHVDDLIDKQEKPCHKITRSDLENSAIDWSQYLSQEKIVLKDKKQLRPHQSEALQKVLSRFQTAERGKLIMACGTGKTFTALKIAEAQAGKGKTVLFLVPSLALLSQTLTEWTQESEVKLHNFAVCSDSEVGKKKASGENENNIIGSLSDLQFPATTRAGSLKKAVEAHRASDAQTGESAMTVIYSTYHSIDVIHQAQQMGLGAFDLVICDEAHRTTGHTHSGDSDSNFVKVHNNDFIRAEKRLYMTATPRIYGSEAKKQAKEDEGSVVLYSMDDEAAFGKTFHTISFSQAVAQGLLVDYKVIVLTVSEANINQRLEKFLSNGEIHVDDAAKIIGCWKALSKQGLSQDLNDDFSPMKRAVAFCQVIEKEFKGKKHKVSSKAIRDMFEAVVCAYQESETDEQLKQQSSYWLHCQAEHVDGGMGALEKQKQINWLKADTPENTCRILSNVRCLSEGVDVPALDAVLFLTPRNSEVDVVQSVGRVMRLAEGKKRGYVILPVVIPAGVEAHKALDNNENYRVVWQVLNALRSHDDRFDAMLNQMQFDGSNSKIEIVSSIDSLKRKTKTTAKQKTAAKAQSSNTIGKADGTPQQDDLELFEIGEIERALTAKIVKKVGNRMYWDTWAEDVKKIAETHISQMNAVLNNPENHEQIAAFNEFHTGLKQDLNDSLTRDEVVEMLSQHIITQPIFDALFKNDDFTKHNPMSQAIEKVMAVLYRRQMDKENERLNEFYDSVKLRVDGIRSAQGKQEVIKELYDKFFNKAFPKLAEKMGIVYTPIEVVDFIIRSVEDILQKEFSGSLKDKGVQIIDPFTGTGTFITRLLQSGIIPPEKLPEKYREIHANEMLLLAYYIASINIETTYHALARPQHYTPFDGICLTDTFAMYEAKDLADTQEENSRRRKRQKALDIKVIIGNPPYSAGQESANDNNANTAYPHLDRKIEQTYAAHSTATNKNSLYDSYIRAIRWASDRIGNAGVIGFITNAGFIEKSTADGMRKCLADEFSSLYVFHLKGGVRGKSGDKAKREGQNIFDIMTAVAISILVKNPNSKDNGKIHFYDIGDYRKRKEKLDIIQQYQSINGIKDWKMITPDGFNDWLNQRDVNFDNYILLGDKKDKTAICVFNNYSMGIKTNRDAWVYSFSCQNLIKNITNCINFYNSEVDRYEKFGNDISVEDFINGDETKISWSRALRNDVKKYKKYTFNQSSLRVGMYRPFTKQNLYFNRSLINDIALIPTIFPENDSENLVICVNGVGARKEFSVLMSNIVPDLSLLDAAQCFPLYLYEKQPEKATPSADLFAEDLCSGSGYQRKDAISDTALQHFCGFYPQEQISKQDIFYYIYGLLHSEQYREQYADNLAKQLPRIPRVKTAGDFRAFSRAGRDLAQWHLHYETAPIYTGVKIKGLVLSKQQIYAEKGKSFADGDFYVEKMKFAQKDDKTRVVYNSHFTIENIPEEAFEYIVNGKSALEWVMERQSVKTDKDSGITNNANDWAIETMNNAKYPLELFLRVMTVSLETVKIVNSLPELVLE